MCMIVGVCLSRLLMGMAMIYQVMQVILRISILTAIAGYRYDVETQLYYLNSRYYNPQWGRFLNADGVLIQSKTLLGHNLFLYCYNNPINGADPLGMWFVNAQSTQPQSKTSMGTIVANWLKNIFGAQTKVSESKAVETRSYTPMITVTSGTKATVVTSGTTKPVTAFVDTGDVKAGINLNTRMLSTEMGVFPGGTFSSGAVMINQMEYKLENSNSITNMSYTFSTMENGSESYVVIDINKVNVARAVASVLGAAGAFNFGGSLQPAYP